MQNTVMETICSEKLKILRSHRSSFESKLTNINVKCICNGLGMEKRCYYILYQHLGSDEWPYRPNKKCASSLYEKKNIAFP